MWQGTGHLYPGTIVRPKRLVNEKSQPPHGNETGDFPACSAVHQPTALPTKGYWPFQFSSTAGQRYEACPESKDIRTSRVGR